MPEMLTQPTPITTLDRVDFVGSPKHIDYVVTNGDVYLKIWVWSGSLTLPYDNDSPPTVEITRQNFNYFVNPTIVEFSEIIAPYIKPKLVGNAHNVTTSGEGVYYQYEVWRKEFSNVDSYNILVEAPPTRFATLGYNYAYEGETTFNYNRGSFGFKQFNINKFYSPYINYMDSTIELSGATDSNSMIKKTPVIKPDNFVKCSPDQYLFVYLNKLGLWDTFTPSGKVTISNEFERKTYTRTYSNFRDYNPSTDHQKTNFNINNKQSYVINTGRLTEEMGQLVEELLDSRMVYLIQFKGTLGTWITADSTLITCDSTLITCDTEYLNNYFGDEAPLYTEFRQIPVIITDTDFGRKTKLNDKNKMNYNIKVEESLMKINNLL